MIIFITKKNHKVKAVPNEIEIKNSLTPQEIDWIKALDCIGFDLETNSLDPYLGSILLMIIGDKNTQYVIDATSIDCEELLIQIIGVIPYNEDSFRKYRRFERLIIGANIKFDYKFVKIKYDITFTKMFDVMIAEQRLNQGMDEFSFKFNKRVNLSAALDKIVQRRLGFVPNGMDKTIREEFIGKNPGTFELENKHIVYAANDISHLFSVREIQKAEISKYDLNFLIYYIEFPLIRVLADAELRGFNIHEDKWRENIKRNKELKFKTEIELDNEIRRLRDTILPLNERIWLKNGKYDRIRNKKEESITGNLFGDNFGNIEVDIVAKKKKKITKISEPYINYSSPDQVVNIIGRLKQLVPKKDGTYAVPQFTTKGKIDKSSGSFTTNAKVIETYKIEVSDTPIKDFVTKLIAFRTYVTRINTFGEEFLIKFKNRVTQRFHTIYRQCDAVSGRLQSGDEENGWYNSQNLPREKAYREPFYDKDNDIITDDLKGAEAVIMIDKARDEKFYQIAIVNDDAHSPLCQAVWRAIGKHRLTNMNISSDPDAEYFGEVYTESSIYKKALSLTNIIISKTENKDKRVDYKPMTFGDIYGMGIKKRAKTLGVSEEESRIAGQTQKAMIPKTYKMVADNAKFAIEHGYIIINNRTNSRMWFTEVLDAKRNHSELSNESKYNVESSAKNTPIQGTQADMVKEIMVCTHNEAERQDLYMITDKEYHKWYREFYDKEYESHDFALLGQVHDETIYSCKDAKRVVEFINDGKDRGIELVTIAEFVKKWHIQVCNRYLSFITMGAEQNIGKTWTK